MPGEKGDPSTVAGEFPDDLGGGSGSGGGSRTAPSKVSSTDVNDPFPKEGMQVINDIFGDYIPSGVWPDGYGTFLWNIRGGMGGGGGTGATTPGTTQLFSTSTTISAGNTPSGLFIQFDSLTFDFASAGGSTTFNATVNLIENGSNFFPTKTTFVDTTTLSGITAAGQTTTASFHINGLPGSFNYIGAGNATSVGSTNEWRFITGSTTTINLQFSVSGLTTQVTPGFGFGAYAFTAYTTAVSSINTLNS